MILKYHIASGLIEYYDTEALCDRSFALCVKDIPSYPYFEWFDTYRKRAYAQGFENVIFESSTHIANNYITKSQAIKQPYVKQCSQVLASLIISSNMNYLIFNAGGNRSRMMPFYEALNTKDYVFNEMGRKIYPRNVITIDDAPNNRARYKINFLNFIANKYDVVLGACSLKYLDITIKYGLKTARKYLVIYSENNSTIKCNTIFKADEGYNFYVWDMDNLGKLTNFKHTKHNKISSLDYIDLQRLS